MAEVWWIVPVLTFIGISVTALRTQQGKAVCLLVYRKMFAYVMSLVAHEYNKIMEPFKKKLFEDMKAQKFAGNLTVLEIGVGSGPNFKFYPPGTSVIALDPNPEFDKYLRKNAEDFGEVVLQQFVIASGENMAAVPDESVDAVVCTLVLCSVTDQVKVIAEVKRVLKPGGKFYYLEHVRASPDTCLHSLQNWLDHAWYYVSDGCTSRSEVWKHLDTAGFSQVNYQRFKAPLKMPLALILALAKPHLMGTAAK